MFISNEKTLRQVKLEFQEKFRWLKLEFYSKAHEAGEGSSAQTHLDDSLTIGQVRSLHSEGELNVHGNMKVSTLESELAARYGLHAQVFRRSGEVWLQTTSTDDWTLSEQNDKGGETSGIAGQATVVDTYEVD